MFDVSSNVQCPYCGTSEWLKAPNTIGERDSAKLFRLLGKTDRGFLVLECPRVFSPFTLRPNKDRTGRWSDNTEKASEWMLIDYRRRCAGRSNWHHFTCAIRD